MEEQRDYNELEQRVDSLDRRLTAVETSLSDIKENISSGFTDMKTELGRIYGERAEWGKWAREHLGTALKWAGAIILGACGITQFSNIVKLFK